MRLTELTAFLFLSLSPGLLAQTESSGPCLAVPHGLSVDTASTVAAGGAASLLISPSGFTTAQPGAWSPIQPNLPNFLSVAQGALGPIDIDAISLGLDIVLSDAQGQVMVPGGHWGGLTFSVTRGTTGMPGSVVNGQATSPGGAAADLFCYILPGSEWPNGPLPPSLVGIVFRARDAAEMGLGAPALNANIDAHDLYLGLIYSENPAQLPNLGPVPPMVLFSVTTASLGNVPQNWWNNTPPSGATVLQTLWTGTSWSMPQPWRRYDQLGLQMTHDLDALAVDWLHQRILFSTTDPALDPILYTAAAGGGTFPYTLPAGGGPVSSKLGLAAIGIDNVDGFSAFDPGPFPLLGSRGMLNVIGTPVPRTCPPLPFSTKLGVSVLRRQAPNGDQFVTTYMTGWPGGAPSPGVAGLLLSGGTICPPYLEVLSFNRPNPANTFEGHPHWITNLKIPPGSFGTLSLHWAAFSFAGSIAVADPVGLDLFGL